MRRFFSSSSAAPLPALPRRLSLMSALTILLCGLAIIPFLIEDLVRAHFNEVVQQAHMLSQVSDMHKVEGRRPARASQALPLVGFKIHTAEKATPTQVWLVMQPQAGPPAQRFDGQELSRWQMFGTIAWIVRQEQDTVFGLQNHLLTQGRHITALTTAGLFQMIISDALSRIIITMALSMGALLLVMQLAVRRLVRRGLDDLFVRLYGSAIVPQEAATRGDLLASLDAFQERLRLHVDEQARLASLGAGASFMAHDMRNLLSSLQLNAEQLQQMPGEKEQRVGKRLAAAIEQALSLAEWATLYTSHKRDNLNVTRQPLAPVIADALNFVRLHDPKRRVELINECDPQAQVVAEPTLLFRIVYNLVLNAMQSMKGHKGRRRVRIEAHSDAQACTVYVSDTGPGLPNQGSGALLMPHMSGFGRPDGTGLGLKIVVDLLSWHGGKIEVARSDAQGTHFKITLPHESPNAPRDDAVRSADGLLDHAADAV